MDNFDNAAAVAKWGPSTLDGLLKQQQDEEERRAKEKAERLITKVGGALSSASNWLMGW